MIKKIKILFFFFLNISLLFSQTREENSYKKQPDTSIISKAEKYVDSIKKNTNKENYTFYKMYSDSLLDFSKKHKLVKYEIIALSNLGIFYKDKLEFEKALSLYHEAVEKYNSLSSQNQIENSRIKMLIFLNIGNVYNDIGAYEKGIDAMKEVVQLSKVNKEAEVFEMSAYNGLGVSYFELKDYAKSVNYFIQVRKLAHKTKNYYAEAVALNNVSDSYFKLENYDKAIQSSEESLLVNEKAKSLEVKAWSLYNLANSFLQLKKVEKAIDYFTQSKTIAYDNNLELLKLHCHENLAKAYELVGDYKNAIEEKNQFLALKSKQNQEKLDATKLDAKKETKSKDTKINTLKKDLTNTDKAKQIIIYSSLSILLFLVSILFFYMKRKKNIQKENAILKTDFAIISNENKLLKNSLKEFANTKQEEDKKQNIKYQTSSLTKEDRDNYVQKILDYMETNKPYLDFDLKQADLAQMLNMSTHHFSEVLNVCFEKNFYNFINIYRINEAQALMKDPKKKEQKMLSIAYESGFNSKTSFNRVFKTYTGLTPSEYRKSL